MSVVFRLPTSTRKTRGGACWHLASEILIDTPSVVAFSLLYYHLHST